MRLSVNIFRSDYDCDINILHGHSSAILVWDEDLSELEPEINGQKVLIVATRMIPSKENMLDRVPHYSVRPLKESNEGKWLMFGGTYVSTSDSRFPSDYPLPLHDRFEG